MTKTARLNKDDLGNFTGSENWYRSAMDQKILLTDGAKHVADEGGAYWLLDEIALAQRHFRPVSREPFQVWKLAVRPDRTATLRCEDGNDNLVHIQEIPFTDFPLDEITFFVANNVIYLPSEH